MHFCMVHPVLLIFLLLLVQTVNISAKEGNDELEISAIEVAAKELTPESYENDPIRLIQILSSDQKSTEYRHFNIPSSKSGVLVFKRNSKDDNKHVVVLQKHEDRLRESLFKRTFVVLFRNSADVKIYHPVLAYYRDSKTIEWDIWSPRSFKGNSSYNLGWVSCRSSIYTPCQSPDTPETNGAIPELLEINPVNKKSDNYSTISKFDYFLDLEDTMKEEFYAFETIQLYLGLPKDASHKASVSGRGMDYYPPPPGAYPGYPGGYYPGQIVPMKIVPVNLVPVPVVYPAYPPPLYPRPAYPPPPYPYPASGQQQFQSQSQGLSQSQSGGGTGQQNINIYIDGKDSNSGTRRKGSDSKQYSSVKNDLNSQNDYQASSNSNQNKNSNRNGAYDRYSESIGNQQDSPGDRNSNSDGNRRKSQNQNSNFVDGWNPNGYSSGGGDGNRRDNSGDENNGNSSGQKRRKGSGSGGGGNRDSSSGNNRNNGGNVGSNGGNWGTNSGQHFGNSGPVNYVTNIINYNGAAPPPPPPQQNNISVTVNLDESELETTPVKIGNLVGHDAINLALGAQAAAKVVSEDEYVVSDDEAKGAATGAAGESGAARSDSSSGGASDFKSKSWVAADGTEYTESQWSSSSNSESSSSSRGSGFQNGAPAKGRSSSGSTSSNPAELLKTDLHTFPGWTTIDRAGKPNDTLTHEADAFVGFGTCVYKRVTKEDYEKAKTPEQVLLVIATALRTNCIEKEMAFYDALLKDGFLQMNAEKTFDVVEDNKFVAREKLSPRRRSELTRAFETALFSKTFKRELDSKTPLTVQQNPISRRVQVLSQAILDGVALANTKLRQHRIKLLRSLAMTLNTVFIKLLQDSEGMRGCEKCTLDNEVIHADQIQLMALLKFLIYGLEPLDCGAASVEEAFKTFNSTNAEVISERVGANL